MSGALLIIVGLIATTVFCVLIIWKIGGKPAEGRVDRAGSNEWLAAAGEAVADARQVAAELTHISSTSSATLSADTTGKLDRLTERLAELSTDAPTAMDTRVCRIVAVRSKALSNALRSSPSPGPRPFTLRPSQQAEFETAVRDFADHVELL